MFLGDVSEERQAEIRRSIEDVMSFFDDRYGIVVPEFSLYISGDLGAIAAHYAERTGGGSMFDASWEGGLVTVTPEGGLLAYIGGAFVNPAWGSDFDWVLAHEYYHLIQHHIVLSGGSSASTPAWITEGMAERSKELFREHRTGVDPRKAWTFRSINEDTSFRDMTAAFGIWYYDMAAFALDWLVDQSRDEDSGLEYWRALGEGVGWQDAFKSAFGITVDGFFEGFGRHRSDLASSAPRIRGTVVDLDDNPLGGVHLSASDAILLNVGPSSQGVTAPDGTFELAVTDGRYFVQLGRVPPPSPDAPYGSIFLELSYSTETGYANTCGPLTDIVVDGADVTGIVIKVLPELLTRAESPPCNEGLPGFFVITANWFGPDKMPIIREFREPDEVGFHVIPIPPRETFVYSGSNPGGSGISRVAVSDGSYVLQIVDKTSGRTRPIGWYGGESGFTADSAEVTEIEVDGADVSGIEIRLPADPADLPTIA